MKLSFGLLLAMAAAAAGDDADGGDDANDANEGNDADEGDDADEGNDADDAGDDANDGYNDGYNANANANAKESWANSIRDKSFYRPGFVNPALKNPLFHKSARSVLDNLGNFKALYVQYENCAWAAYGQSYVEQKGEDGADGGGSFLGCASGDGDDEHWYMGRTPCFRAQAAFSLYGIPKGHSGSLGSKCHKATFINSFFTTMGVEALANPLGVDTTYGNSYCTVYPPDDDAAMNDDADKGNFAAYTSSGTGCQHNRFVTDTYGGANCDGNDYVKTTDTLGSFNKALDNLDCVQIYDSSSGYVYENDDDGDGDDGDGGNVDFTALDNNVEILKYSITCNVLQYPDDCPDRHGVLSKYEKNLKGALAKADMWSKGAGEKAMNALTVVLFCFSLLMGLTILRKRRRLTRMSKAPLSPPVAKDDPSVVSSAAASATALPSTVSSVAASAAALSSIVSSAAASAAASVRSVLQPKETLPSHEVTFMSDRQLGMTIMGSAFGCYVRTVIEGSQAAQDERVQVGDIITNVGRRTVSKGTSLNGVLGLIKLEKAKNSQFVIGFRKP